MEIEQNANRVIQVKAGVVGPREPRLKTIKIKKLSDYPEVPRVYLEVAKNYSSPFLVGPPISDEFIALIRYMFTEEEASIVRHIKPLSRKTAAMIAASAHRPIEEIIPILSRLADQLHILLTTGEGDEKHYLIMPIVPGTFEAVMTKPSTDTFTDWHRRFAELFEALYETGFLIDYLKHPTPGVRYLPVKKSIESHPMAWPSDKLEEILDHYNYFAVGTCSCRMVEKMAGKWCGRTLENCTWFGEYAEVLVRSGLMRRVEKKDVLEIKAEAEANGMVSWMNNVDSKVGTNVSCSCCGCCCKMLRTVNEFNMPGMIAPPHFLPKINLSKCSSCAKCAKACPMAAITVDTKSKILKRQMERCIGCGLCAVACDEQHAVSMEPTAKHNKLPSNYTSLFLRLTPNYLRNTLSGWKTRWWA